MWLNVAIWLVVLVVVVLITRRRHKGPTGMDHPDVLRSQPAYRHRPPTDS